MALIEKLKNIANAIRSKTNKSEEMTLEQMASEVSNIYSPKTEEVRKVNIDENGTIVVNPSEGSDVMKEVEISVRVNGYDNGYDFTTIGYEKDESDTINLLTSTSINVAKEIIDNWDVNNTTCIINNQDIIYFPMLNTSNVQKFWFQCKNLKYMPKNFDVSAATDLAYCWHECKNLEYAPETLNVINAISINRILNNCPKLQKLPILQNTNNVKNFEFAFSNLLLRGDLSLNTDSATSIYGLAYASVFDNIYLTSIKYVTNLTYPFRNCTNLVQLRFTEWKTQNLEILQSSNISIESIKYIIWHALNGENVLGFENQGAISRVLTLHATTYTSWETWKLTKPSVEDCEFLGIDETKITKYGELTWEDIALNVKLITIAK